ncbi:hypothetical protein J5X84_41175 [Streptosporangiaceae bacterium NEAU-GS5]|nr:hypothetical protein [Streptosporangiaceae bacterium NEAU-GS5]
MIRALIWVVVLAFIVVMATLGVEPALALTLALTALTMTIGNLPALTGSPLGHRQRYLCWPDEVVS